jgi:arylsulfatase A-like enzyme
MQGSRQVAAKRERQMKVQVDRRSFLKLLSWLPLLALTARNRHTAERTTSSRPAPDQPNVLILLFDTFSARHLTLHGYPRETTPNLDRFARSATVYHSHYASGSFTAPGTASLLTGTYPWTHRALHHAGIVLPEYADRSLLSLMATTHHTLAYPHNMWANLLLHQFQKDVETYVAAEEFCLVDGTFHDRPFVNDASIAFRSLEDMLFREISVPGSLFLGLADELKTLAHERIGLKELADSFPRGVPTLGMYQVFFLLEDVIDGIMALIDDAPQPFLAYLHLFPPHEPYRPRHDFVGIFDDGWSPVAKQPHPLSPGKPQEELNQQRLQYDEYIAYVDSEFGRLHDWLDRAGLLRNTYLVVTSDHGQMFERGVHGHDTPLLYEPVIHVPLLISRPGQQQRIDIHTPTSCIDVSPTLLQATGHPIPAWCQGAPLPGLGDEEPHSPRSVFALDSKRSKARGPLVQATVALRRGPYKLIHYRGYPGLETTYELYDVENDPEEMDDLYSTQRSVAAELQRELQEKLEEANRPYTS